MPLRSTILAMDLQFSIKIGIYLVLLVLGYYQKNIFIRLDAINHSLERFKVDLAT